MQITELLQISSASPCPSPCPSRNRSGAKRPGTPRHTVFTTNTSTLPPSALAGFVDRPQKFLALHFAIGVWDANIGEVMGHPSTDPAVFESLLMFAEEIGLVPIPIRKEQNGYIINSLIVPWCTAAMADPLRRGPEMKWIRTLMISPS